MSVNGLTPGGKTRWKCHTGGYCYGTTNPNPTVATDQKGSPQKRRTAPKFNRHLHGAKAVLVTCAQNATPVHEGFMKALEVAADKLNAEILVIPTRYKNPTSTWSASQRNEEFWDARTVPYLCNERKRFHKHVMIMGDVPIQPTAVSPLTGNDGITHGESGIFGHSKLQLRTVATPVGKLPKILTTTGMCTKPNYTDTRTGKLGEHHYTLGACLVQADGSKFHMRQINADKKTGEFYDLDTVYSAQGTRKAGPALKIFLGDTHVDSTDPLVTAATFGKGGMCDVLRPQFLAYNDLVDGYAVNHHHKSFLTTLAKIRFNRGCPKAEIERAAQFVIDNTPKFSQAVVIPSNHNDFIQQWLLNTDPRSQPSNARFWCETFLALEKTLTLGLGGTSHADACSYWLRKLLPASVRILERGEEWTLGGVANYHGDEGPNGARGNIKNLARIGSKVDIGHGHSPGINEGAYQAGTSTVLQLEYTGGGPSSWLNSHILQYANGKRSLLNIVGGRWRAA